MLTNTSETHLGRARCTRVPGFEASLRRRSVLLPTVGVVGVGELVLVVVAPLVGSAVGPGVPVEHGVAVVVLGRVDGSGSVARRMRVDALLLRMGRRRRGWASFSSGPLHRIIPSDHGTNAQRPNRTMVTQSTEQRFFSQTTDANVCQKRSK